jgi:DNA mismatch endonuclease (patch repair protein)
MKFDNLTTEQRQRVMRRVQSKDTQPELLVRRYLHAAGFRFRLHDACLPGTPDVVLPRYRTLVFVQGCFWHSHSTACLRKSREAPKTNAEFWQTKLAVNQARDQRIQQQLHELGWRVLVVWECELRRTVRGATLHRLLQEILLGEEDAAAFVENDFFTFPA